MTEKQQEAPPYSAHPQISPPMQQIHSPAIHHNAHAIPQQQPIHPGQQYQHQQPQHMGGGTMQYGPPIGDGAMYQQQMMAECARGNHSNDTKYGVVGIIVAICLFPCGLVALCVDRKKICTRCGHQTY